MQISLTPTFLVLSLAAVVSACAPIQHATKEVVATTKAPAAIGPYSQAIRSGNLLFISGQIPIDPATNQIPANADIEEQTKITIENIRAVLGARGLTLADVVSTQVYMTDLSEFPRMNAIYGSYFKEAPPARATVGVARLPREVKVEIAAVAAVRSN